MIRLTGHAQRRLDGREIEIGWVVETIESPDWIASDSDPALTRSFKAIDQFGGRVLGVVHRADGADILVIIAYFDRNAP